MAVTPQSLPLIGFGVTFSRGITRTSPAPDARTGTRVSRILKFSEVCLFLNCLVMFFTNPILDRARKLFKESGETPMTSRIFFIFRISQSHSHAQLLKVNISGGPLDNQTWQTEWKTTPLAKVQLCEYENQTLEAETFVCSQSFVC